MEASRPKRKGSKPRRPWPSGPCRLGQGDVSIVLCRCAASYPCAHECPEDPRQRWAKKRGCPHACGRAIAWRALGAHRIGSRLRLRGSAHHSILAGVNSRALRDRLAAAWWQVLSPELVPGPLRVRDQHSRTRVVSRLDMQPSRARAVVASSSHCGASKRSWHGVAQASGIRARPRGGATPACRSTRLPGEGHD